MPASMAKKSKPISHVFSPGSAPAGRPPSLPALLAQGRALHQAGRLPEAERLYREVLRQEPRQAGALHFLGVLAFQAGHAQAAAELIAQAVAADPRAADAHANLGLALHASGRPADALASLDRALALRPDSVEALGNRGVVLSALGRDGDALDALDAALARQPANPEFHFARGNALLALRRADEAVPAYDACLQLAPGHVDAHVQRGNAQRMRRRPAQALEDYDAALARAPHLAGVASNRGDVLMELKRYAQAAEAYGQALALDTGYPYAPGKRLHARAMACDWRDWEREVAALEAAVAAGRRAVEPFAYSAIARTPRQLLDCARLFADDQFPARTPLVPPGHRRPGRAKIRLGYLSGEFRNQATAHLAVELFELHDRERFELLAFDNGWDDGSELRRRVVDAFDEVVDIAALSDEAAAGRIARHEIDVLVNLNGWFGLGRTGVFARRPAPLQVNYLGFPGTMGASYLDALVADGVVVPAGEDDAYVERVLRLPRCYQPNDRRRAIAAVAPSRAEAGLPGRAVVFACFNNTYKIAPDVFGAWMRILRAVDGSVLWLLEDNPDAGANLRAAAEAHGVAPDRLRWAPRLRADEHLARHGLADLFLDTLPYNAHTTGSDALWAGLPLLTCLGTTFPGRVGASLLRAVGLADELVVDSLDAYEARAIELARHPARLAGLRASLRQSRQTAELWDSPGYVRDFEAALVRLVAGA
jgi:predicted O-linked N-acetylglucosamine transferase (SPINDLY family)